MSTFFDIAQDLPLLDRSVRESAELETIIEQVEYDVIEFYRQSRYPNNHVDYAAFFESENGSNFNDDLIVRLRGYNAESPEDSEAKLQKALKYTIADVASFTIKNYDNERGLEGEGRGKRSWDYADGGLPTKDQWPSNWNRRLAKFDARDPVYAV